MNVLNCFNFTQFRRMIARKKTIPQFTEVQIRLSKICYSLCNIDNMDFQHLHKYLLLW